MVIYLFILVVFISIHLFILMSLIAKFVSLFYHPGTKSAWENKHEIWFYICFGLHTHAPSLQSPSFLSSASCPLLFQVGKEDVLILFLHFNSAWNCTYWTVKPHITGSYSPSTLLPLLLGDTHTHLQNLYGTTLHLVHVPHTERDCSFSSRYWSFRCLPAEIAKTESGVRPRKMHTIQSKNP